uniref:Keratin n=1 Tax=Ficedula albicollis TaxID=59894 RepID=U3JG99_FICAL
MLNVGPECLQGCEVTCSQPCAYSRSLEPCVASCGDSRAVVFPPPVVLTFPGPTLSTCSQESVVGASHPMVFGAQNVSDESYGVGGSFGASQSPHFSGSGGKLVLTGSCTSPFPEVFPTYWKSLCVIYWIMWNRSERENSLLRNFRLIIFALKRN